MKQKKGITTGLLLIFSGIIWILWNMGLLRYEEWEAVLRYWPALLILAGLFMIVGGEYARSISVLLIVLAAVAGITYNSGRFKRNLQQDWWEDRPRKEERQERNRERARRTDKTDNSAIRSNRVAYEITPEIKEGVLKVEGGAGIFKIKETSEQMFEANIESNLLEYNSSLKTNKIDGVATIVLKQDDKPVKLRNSRLSNDVNLYLNPDLLWNIALNIGAGKAELDLSKFRIKEVDIETGASALDIKLGDRTDRQEIKIESGLATLDIEFPVSLGCEVKINGDLNLENFIGFEKVSRGIYRTPEFANAKKKAFLELDAGLSKININKY